MFGCWFDVGELDGLCHEFFDGVGIDQIVDGGMFPFLVYSIMVDT